MKKSERLLGKYTVSQLTYLFNTRGTEPRVIAALQAELPFRKPAGLEKLRTAVSLRTGRAFAQAPPTGTSAAGVPPLFVIVGCIRCGARVRFAYHKDDTVATCPKCRQDYNVAWQGSACLIQPRGVQPPRPSVEPAGGRLTVDQAYAALGATSAEKWNPGIKQKGRSLLQQYHPDKSSSAPLAVQKLAEKEFKRVNEAYQMLEGLLGK